MNRVAIGISALLCGCLVAACDDRSFVDVGSGPGETNNSNVPGWSSDPRLVTDPDGKSTPLKNVGSDSLVGAAMKGAGDVIDKYRSKGVDALIEGLKKDLAVAGIATGSIDGINDRNLGKLGASGLDANGNPQSGGGLDASGNPIAGIDAQGHPVPNGVGDFAKYFACPILAPEPTQEDDCTKLVQPTVLKVQAEIEQRMADVASEINAAYADLPDEARSFVTAWGQTALRYGVSVATIYATEELRAAGKCDTKVAGLKVSHNLGIEQGMFIVVGHYGWAQAQVQTCVTNTDVIAFQVRDLSLTEVTTFMTKHPVCVDADFNPSNQVLVTAEGRRQEGIKVGIAQQVEVLRGLLVQWRAAACVPAGGDGGGGGDPLAIDLDGQGLGFSAAPVLFDLLADGHAQRVSWVGPRAALLAIDLDGDGRISSGAELFGDRSDCGSARCLDGVMALGDHDRQARGGNGDGQIDSRDAVYTSLRLWTDANQDGVSQPSELSALGESGVLALSLQADRRGMGNASGASTAELQVLTRDGFRTAYELWLQLGLTTENLAALKP